MALLAAALLAAGCSRKNQPTGPTGDNTGEHLVIYTTDAGRAVGNYGVALYDLDLGGYHAMPGLDDGNAQSDPCISNDGNFIAFAAVRGGGATGSDIYVYDRLNQVLLPTPGLNTVRDETWPRFTYDSVKLAFARRIATGEKRVRLYEPVGDTLVALPGLDAPGGLNDDMPAPNLDGTRIAFVSDRAGNPDVFLWNRATGIASLPALASPGTDTEPALTADGRWLAFASNRAGGAGGYDVYLFDLVADSLVALPGLNSAGDDRHPSVSADGNVIVFQSNRAGGGGQDDIYRYVRSPATLDQPPQFKSASDDIQPYLRWR